MDDANDASRGEDGRTHGGSVQGAAEGDGLAGERSRKIDGAWEPIAIRGAGETEDSKAIAVRLSRPYGEGQTYPDRGHVQTAVETG